MPEKTRNKSNLPQALLTPQPEVNIFNQNVLTGIWHYPDKNLSTFLMALAAVQRGLKVTFWGSSTQARVEAWGAPITARRPRLFTVEDGSNRHFFDKTQGDKTSAQTTNLCRNKDATKDTLKKAGIYTPSGLHFTGKNRKNLTDFLNKSKARTFVIKPLSASRGKGVFRGVTAERILKSTAQLHPGEFLVEEQIRGREYRVYVVGNKVAGVNLRPESVVVGNGRASIAQLVYQKNEQRKINPHLRHHPIDLTKVGIYLAKSGRSLKSVPVFGQPIVLTDSIEMSAGGTVRNGLETISEEAARTAINACKALDLPHGGVDLIEGEDGVYVLEANTRANIDKHSFPDSGRGSVNAVAEAIIDDYFPSTTPIQRDRGARFDIKALVMAFQNANDMTRHELRIIPE